MPWEESGEAIWETKMSLNNYLGLNHRAFLSSRAIVPEKYSFMLSIRDYRILQYANLDPMFFLASRVKWIQRLVDRCPLCWPATRFCGKPKVSRHACHLLRISGLTPQGRKCLLNRLPHAQYPISASEAATVEAGGGRDPRLSTSQEEESSLMRRWNLVQ